MTTDGHYGLRDYILTPSSLFVCSFKHACPPPLVLAPGLCFPEHTGQQDDATQTSGVTAEQKQKLDTSNRWTEERSRTVVLLWRCGAPLDLRRRKRREPHPVWLMKLWWRRGHTATAMEMMTTIRTTFARRCHRVSEVLCAEAELSGDLQSKSLNRRPVLKDIIHTCHPQKVALLQSSSMMLCGVLPRCWLSKCFNTECSARTAGCSNSRK